MLCAATWRALDLVQSDMLKLILGKAGHTIEVERKIPNLDMVWPELQYVTFQPSSKSLWYRRGNINVAYVLATSLLVLVCLCLVNLYRGNLPVARLAGLLKKLDIVSWQDSTSIALLLAEISYISLLSVLVLICSVLPDAIFGGLGCAHEY